MEALSRLSSFSDGLPFRNGHTAPANREWAPLIEVIETNDAYLIRADLPGVDKSDDISVRLEGGELILMGTRQAEPLAEGAQYKFTERPYGTFTRRFVLPSWADASHIHADYKHGVLTVKVEKGEQAKAREIAIQGE